MQVVHCRKAKYDEYIGRENIHYGLPASKWANPFVIGKDGTRDEVLAMYEEYIELVPELLAALHELEGKTLGCWCHPQKCHGDVLVKLYKKHVKSKKFLTY